MHGIVVVVKNLWLDRSQTLEKSATIVLWMQNIIKPISHDLLLYP